MVVEGQLIGKIGPSFRFTTLTDARSRSELAPALHKLLLWMHMAFPRGDPNNSRTVYRHPANSSFAILEGKFPPRREKTYKIWKSTRSKVRRWKEVTVARKPWAAPYDFTESIDDFVAHQQFRQTIYKHYVVALDKVTREASFGNEDHVAAFVSIWTEKVLDGMNGDAIILDYVVKVVNRLADEGRCLFAMPNGFAGSGPLDMKDGDQVYLVPGVRSPMLLRSEGEVAVFSLVGPALIHGVMRGEEFMRSKLTGITIR